ncbi:MAG: FAD-binding oxidoreductase [Actinomycetota bacterium]|nr:FAD-binding oxidoreductase [Actinomycetota bacterium]
MRPGAGVMTYAVSELARELAEEIGDAAVVLDATRLDDYTADTYWKALAARASGAPLGRPELVVVPASEQDVASALGVANRRRVPVVPWGGGSGSQGGAVPTEGGIVLDLRALDRIVEIDEESLTVTAQAGVNGRRLEGELNERGLMLPHYPASADLATVGGYVAARGSGVLSTRYGKIEDLVLSLRVVTPTGETLETVGVPRHAVGPDLTQLFVGSEGTLGVVTQATLQLTPLPAARRFEAVSFPSVASGVAAVRSGIARGLRPSVVRLYDEVATRQTLGPVVGEELDGVSTVFAFEGEPGVVDAEAERMLAIARDAGARVLDKGIGRTWWARRYEFYKPPHHPELPAIWGTIEAVATYGRILAVYDAVREAMRPYERDALTIKIHFSHWYPWGTMIYGRFVVPDGGAEAVTLHDRIWEDGVRAILGAGGVMNDHHGVGLKLAPYMRAQHGGGLDALRRIKEALDPNGIMNPGKLGL